MAHTTYDGYSITELRRYAGQYKIVGRSKMDGDQLLRAVQQVWIDDRKAKEAEFLAGGPVAAGMTLKTRCGCTVQASTGVREDLRWEDVPVFVFATYVELCDKCSQHYPAGVDYLNRYPAQPEGDRWPLYLLAARKPVMHARDEGADVTKCGKDAAMYGATPVASLVTCPECLETCPAGHVAPKTDGGTCSDCEQPIRPAGPNVTELTAERLGGDVDLTAERFGPDDRAILKALGDSRVSAAELATRLRIRPGRIRGRLAALESSGQVRREGGMWERA